MQSFHPITQREDTHAAVQVTVRLLPTDAIGDCDPALLSRLDAAEAIQAAKFVHAEDRKAWLGAHALLRTLLAQALPGEQAPRAWRFVAGPKGKPSLAPGQASRDVRFNISHCRGMAAVALAFGADIGVDVEALERADFDERAIAESHFCVAEREKLARLEEAGARKREFLAVWTAKEALIKGVGEGLSMPLDAFCADLERNAYARHDGAPDAWMLARWERPGHLAALAAPRGARVDCRELRWDASAGVFVEGMSLDSIAGTRR